MKNINEIIQDQLATLDRGFIATPENFETLEAFAKANHGSNDFLLTHMAMQYGMKLALEFLATELAESATAVNPNNIDRSAYVANALGHAWNMGKGNNAIASPDNCN